MGNRVRQRTLLNLGTHFDIEKPLRPLLCSRVLQLLRKENPLFALECPEALESKARYIYAQLVERDPKKNSDGPAAILPEGNFQPIDVDNAELIRNRTTVGVEKVALWAMQSLGQRTKITCSFVLLLCHMFSV